MTDSTNKPWRRADPRIEASDWEIHGIATRKAGKEQGPFVIFDVSDAGLRLWMSDQIDHGEVMRLTIAKPFLVLLNVEARWCKATSDGSGYFVGVKAIDNLGRLEALQRELSELKRDDALLPNIE